MRWVSLTLAFAIVCAPLLAADTTTKTAERLDDSASLFSEIMSTPDRAIPQELLERAQCVVIVPELKKAAFVVGAKYGRGFAVCRGAAGAGWGPPAAIRIEGGSVGFQVGVSSTDVLMLVMNKRGMRRLSSSKFTIGGDAAAAAGPVGRSASAQTDAFVSAEILSYSRSKGLFAGVSLEGATLRNDLDENGILYGKRWTSKQILGSGAKMPEAASKLIAVLNKYSMRERK
jgi:lipid-binding SYLF domain-containing protein